MRDDKESRRLRFEMCLVNEGAKAKCRQQLIKALEEIVKKARRAKAAESNEEEGEDSSDEGEDIDEEHVEGSTS